MRLPVPRRPLVALLAVAAACGSSTRPAPAAPSASGESCAPPAVQAPAPELAAAGMVQDLGTVQVGQRATFQVPPGTGGLLIVAQEVGWSAPDVVTWGGVSVQNGVVPTDVRDPSGALVWDDLANLAPDPSQPAYGYGFVAGAGTFVIPNTSAALTALRSGGQLAAGTWSFAANDWATECLSVSGCSGGSRSGVYRYYAVTKPGLAAGGTLDLDVHLATDPTNAMTALTSAANAASSAAVARWVSTLGSLLGGAGVTLGAVRFHDLSDADRARFAANGSVDITDPGPCGNLQQLFAAASSPSRAVQLFLADELKLTGGSGTTRVVGVDGAIPGPAGVPGTVASGAVVGVFDDIGRGMSSGACDGPPNFSGCGSDAVAYVAAHEIGHWLGLFHPTELTGGSFDPLSDTATCPCSSCAPAADQPHCWDARANGTTEMLNAYCTGTTSCGGGRNLMFWLFDPRYSTGELSADQGQVARQNPVVR